MENYPRTYTKWMRRLALGLIVGPPLLTITWLILDQVSTGYQMWDIVVSDFSPVSQPISGLGMGDTALYMNTVLVAYGLLVMLGSFGALRLIKGLNPGKQLLYSNLLALHGIGAIMCGLFNLESFMLHSLGFLLVLTPIVTFPIIGAGLRNIKQWHTFGTWFRWAGPLTLVLAVWYFATFNPERAGENLGIAGLTERILVIEILAWLLSLGLAALLRSQKAT